MTKNEALLIRKALLCYEMREIKYLDSLPDVEVQHSREYLDSMARLSELEIKRSKKARIYKRLLVACIVALTLLLASACVFIKTVSDFFVEIFESFTTFSTENTDTEITKTYLPHYIPEGYAKGTQTATDLFISTTYVGSDGKILFNQTPLNNEHLSVDTEDSGYTEHTFGNQTVYYINQNGIYLFVWENGEYSFKLKCPEALTMEDIEKIILSVLPNEKSNDEK